VLLVVVLGGAVPLRGGRVVAWPQLRWSSDEWYKKVIF